MVQICNRYNRKYGDTHTSLTLMDHYERDFCRLNVTISLYKGVVFCEAVTSIITKMCTWMQRLYRFYREYKVNSKLQQH